jgi:hypothetical protein
MSDFQERLRKAIERGSARGYAKEAEAQQKQLTDEEFRSLHSKARLQLSDQIERCVGQLPNHFPGFRTETIFGERGWGAAAFRDDIDRGASGRAANFYSRLEMTVRPYSHLRVLELTAKGTIRNKEVFNRTHFEELQVADLTTFSELIDVWVLEYAELYAASR